ncbi:MAG: hypothetical protein KME27_25580 [Lyngbya sp. HA4199-MV5]|jgi:hypothetical protein|nr:hypothetical protein [Lyngbya sp. HA4199-MV5]
MRGEALDSIQSILDSGMRTIETTATITADGQLTLQVPPDLLPGQHRVVLVIDEPSVPTPQRSPFQISAYPVGLASPALTFRREDLYGDS